MVHVWTVEAWGVTGRLGVITGYYDGHDVVALQWGDTGVVDWQLTPV